MESEVGFLKQSDNRVYCSFKAETNEDKINLFNALENCDFKLNDCVGQTIAVKNIYIEERDTEDQETGEPRLGHRTILFSDDGKSYVTGSNYLYYTVRKIMAVWGEPSSWLDPIKVKVIKKQVKDNRMALSLELVLE